MSYSYHPRNGLSTPKLILFITFFIIIGFGAVVFALNQEPTPIEPDIEDTIILNTDDDVESPPQDTNTEDSTGSEPEGDTTDSDLEETDQEEEASEDIGEPNEDSGTTQDITFNGTVLAGTTAPLLDFTQADYEAALASDKLVVLYFYANWCPICRVEVDTALYPAFNQIDRTDVVGFRVNFNDNQTDNNEKNLAREYGVAYQHTKVFVKNGERILKSPESWDVDRYLTEITNILN